MDFLIAGLLVLVLAVTLVSVYLLRQETVKNLCDVKKRLDVVNSSLLGLREAIEKLIRIIQERDGQRITEHSQILAQLKDLLGESSSRADEDSKQSRAIEEGIANLLQYQVGKGKESS